MILYRNLLLILFSLLVKNSWSQATTFNYREVLGQYAAVFTSVEATDSCYYVTGVVAYSQGGAIAPVFLRYDTAGNYIDHSFIYDTVGWWGTWSPTLQTDYDGSLVVSTYFKVGPNYQGGLLKYDHQGNRIWSVLHTDPYPTASLLRVDDMKQTVDSGYILVNTLSGPYFGAGPVSDMGVMKLNKYGQEEWQVTRGIPSTVEHTPCIVLDTDSTYVIGYQQDAVTGSPGTSIIKSHIERLDKNGDTIWTYTSPSNQQIYGVNDLVHTKDSGFVAASAWGYEEIIGSGNAVYHHHSYLYKINKEGQLLWDRVFYSEYDDRVEFTKLIELEDSSIVAFGSILRAYPQPNPTYGFRRGRIVKVSPSGDSLWNREYEYLTTGGARHTIYDAEHTPDGGFLIAGEANGVGSGVAQQGWLLKIDEHGCLVPGCHILSATVPEPQEQLELQLYPNPCQQYLNVYYPIQEATGKTLEWRLIDVQGRVVQSYERPDVGAKTYVFDVQGLSTGIYFLELRRDGVVLVTEEVVKQ